MAEITYKNDCAVFASINMSACPSTNLTPLPATCPPAGRLHLNASHVQSMLLSSQHAPLSNPMPCDHSCTLLAACENLSEARPCVAKVNAATPKRTKRAIRSMSQASQYLTGLCHGLWHRLKPCCDLTVSL